MKDLVGKVVRDKTDRKKYLVLREAGAPNCFVLGRTGIEQLKGVTSHIQFANLLEIIKVKNGN